MAEFNEVLKARESVHAARRDIRMLLEEFRSYRQGVEKLILEQSNSRELFKRMPKDDLQVLVSASCSADRLAGVADLLTSVIRES